jgi:hypothetical protein
VASPSSIRMPREAIAVLQRVANLDELHANALVNALSTGEARDLSALKTAVTRAVGDVWQDQEAIDSFVTNFISMLALGTTRNLTADHVANVLTENVGSAVEKDGGSKEVLSRRLVALLTARDLVAVGKAADIITEYDQVLNLARIISDIRPVFGNNASDDPMGAVIVHTLKIDYFHDNRVNTISFALDADDLADLKRVVDRAQEKQRTLSRTLHRAGLPEFDMTKDDNG